MTIEEVYEHKKEAEKTIEDAIAKFRQETGLKVRVCFILDDVRDGEKIQTAQLEAAL